MQNTLFTLLKRLDSPELEDSEIISWGAPVPSFGDLKVAKIATLGLNPSNREFVDLSGNELDGERRRFHTLKSLGLKKWSDANYQHMNLIEDSCKQYFSRNPYDGWFKGLDQIISGTNTSYYSNEKLACHLDLIPYATRCKWTDLDSKQKYKLLNEVGDTLGLLLKQSPIKILVLNGKSVVDNFEKLTLIKLDEKKESDWNLARNSGKDVVGYSYSGTVREIAGVRLPKEIVVLGFNHNIQSSFGVTTKVKNEIKNWITKSTIEIFT